MIPCPICGEGMAEIKTDMSDVYPAEYYLCDTCKSEFADIEMVKKNKEARIRHNRQPNE